MTHEHLINFIIIVFIFFSGFYFGFKKGCSFVWKKLLNYLRSKGKSDIEIGNVFIELSKTKLKSK